MSYTTSSCSSVPAGESEFVGCYNFMKKSDRKNSLHAFFFTYESAATVYYNLKLMNKKCSDEELKRKYPKLNYWNIQTNWPYAMRRAVMKCTRVY
jgi:hypothetical protein